MIYEKNVPVKVGDGSILRANVFRPDHGKPVPVLMTHGPYGKDAHFEDAFKPQWDALKALYPCIDTDGSTGRYLRWEVPDPERWVPWGYAVVVVDSRGAGESPGQLWCWSPEEVQDYHDCIEWAGTQAWSSGKVGLIGISYYAMNQWQVAALRPSHLAAICPWEGASDFYRDVSHHGGIFSNAFLEFWFPKQILSVQNCNGQSTYVDRETGRPPTGKPLTDAALRTNRVDAIEEFKSHPLLDDWYDTRTARLGDIEVPVLSSGNWGGMGLHLRGNVEGFMAAGSRQKWLQMHGGTHWDSFYLPEYVAMQKRFFDHFLKGMPNGWDAQPPLMLDVRHVDHFERRHATQWPLPETQWCRYALDAQALGLDTGTGGAQASASYAALGPGVEFLSAPMAEQTEFTGPVAAVLWVSASAADMDLFLTLRAYDLEGNEVAFIGATEPVVPIAQGWLRVSHRRLDAEKSTFWRPWHDHRVAEPMQPGQPYRVEVEIWPTSIVLPPGYRLALRVDGRDFAREGATGPRKGSGPFLHTDADDRNPAVFAGTNTIHTGGRYDSHLLMPKIPAHLE